MQYRIEILEKGDSILNIWEGHIAVQKKSGDVEVFQYYFDESGFPRLDKNTLLITQGGGAITVVNDNNTMEITTF